MNRYISSLDKMSVIISWCVAGLGLIGCIIGYMAYLRAGRPAIALISAALGPVIIASLAIAMYYLQPRAVTVDDAAITIERKISPLSLKLDDLKSVRRAIPDEMSGVIRTFGNGGLFGYTGMYYNKALGSMRWYCTQRRHYIIIDKTNNKRIIITPDDPDAFLRDVYTRRPALAGK